MCVLTYNSVKFKPLCPAALDALLEMYKALPLPSDMTIASIRAGEITDDQFEEVLFRQLLKYSANRIAFKATDLNSTRVTDVHIKYRNVCNDIWTQVESDIVENSSSGNRCDYIHDPQTSEPII